MRKELLIAIKQGKVNKFYTSRTWKRKRKEILIRDNHECQACKRKGKFSKATCVHHKKHLKERPDLALADENLESLCDTCHNYEHPEKLWQPDTTKHITVERW